MLKNVRLLRETASLPPPRVLHACENISSVFIPFPQACIIKHILLSCLPSCIPQFFLRKPHLLFSNFIWVLQNIIIRTIFSFLNMINILMKITWRQVDNNLSLIFFFNKIPRSISNKGNSEQKKYKIKRLLHLIDLLREPILSLKKRGRHVTMDTRKTRSCHPRQCRLFLKTDILLSLLKKG